MRRAKGSTRSAKGRTSVFVAARRAEPLFLLAGVVRNRDFAFYEKAKNQRKSSRNRSDRPARTSRAKKTRFFRSRWRIGVDFNCLGALPGAPGPPKSIFCFHKDIFEDSPGTPGTARDTSKASLRRSRHALGDHRASQEGPGIDFDSILDAPESPGIGFTPIFALSLLGKPLENSPRMPRNIL